MQVLEMAAARLMAFINVLLSTLLRVLPDAKVAEKLPIFTPLKTCKPEKIEALTPLGVKSGKYNGTTKRRGLKVVIFLATFSILFPLFLQKCNQSRFFQLLFCPKSHFRNRSTLFLLSNSVFPSCQILL